MSQKNRALELAKEAVEASSQEVFAALREAREKRALSKETHPAQPGDRALAAAEADVLVRSEEVIAALREAAGSSAKRPVPASVGTDEGQSNAKLVPG